MTIEYQTAEGFYEGVYQLVRKGLSFRADFDNLRISLLGGF